MALRRFAVAALLIALGVGCNQNRDTPTPEDYQAVRNKANADRSEGAADRAGKDADYAGAAAEKAKAEATKAQQAAAQAKAEADRAATTPAPSVPAAVATSDPPQRNMIEVRLRCSSDSTATLRAAPSIHSERVTSVGVGTEVQLLGEEAVDHDFHSEWRWFRVRAGDSVGWLHQNSLDGMHDRRPCR